MCGVIGMVAKGPVNQDLYEGLTVLQHRGQDAAGIITYDQGQLSLRKSNGLVRDVFRTRHMMRLTGNIGIGHVRYPTAGCESSAEAQPFYVNSPYGISLAHNGNLTNTEELKQELFRTDRRHINTNSDSEILLNILAHELSVSPHDRLEPGDLFSAVEQVHRRCHGAYSAVAMINGYGILAFRDPFGIRPLCFGERDTEQGREYLIASESVALDMLGFRLVREVAPGEAIFIDMAGELHTRQCAEDPVHAPCLFEYVYLSRPDSIVDGVAVHKARLRMGERLAAKIRREWPEHDIDVIIPIPDTSRTVAMQLAYQLGVESREGFIKNRYVGRTFIMPGQAARKKSVRQKLNPIPLEFEGKNVLLVDDSVVRGTTSQQLVQLARESGARRVYLASAAPPVRYPNVYGIDMPAPEELIAHNRDEAEITEAIGADRMIYQELADLEAAVADGNPQIRQFDSSCFNGQYVTGGVSQDYLRGLSQARADAAREKARSDQDLEIVDVHNQA
ncbi:MAG: amidophosphoribosyltransferase [Halorhodospira halophila]|uniref:amidophosphoribosyltransferase n=1 Tax=Halorhodospira TaxID=85108 RepID=UPI0019127BED|nr:MULTISPECIES: amidophosphoribosyltransferase [Halorhodospira]MBK5936257.1 amidophosphoribosyltransferase [Halorhodospira halophila]MBK5944116.1 amidophosphoribosyltransferase [Halorhodospira halophila]MCC3749850.1 amidophosphoribosyltransferase [Halorhodospira halophila]MCG5527770.1 amidophosphoribosyltransferase [Halorhodospira halophila]MCG5532762.1 amidophosphoribosyltransferase [Halorhodospira sp. 9621]